MINSDLLKYVSKSEGELLKVEETLEKFIETNEIIDDITKTKWGKQGVKNFVTVNMDDTLKNVVDKMKELDDSLSVRAVVMEKDAPKAIVTYDMISKELQK
jgi:signal-transduction protein with cAMP-binding, CBS, and nucleotidyltransferase domain